MMKIASNDAHCSLQRMSGNVLRPPSRPRRRLFELNTHGYLFHTIVCRIYAKVHNETKRMKEKRKHDEVASEQRQ